MRNILALLVLLVGVSGCGTNYIELSDGKKPRVVIHRILINKEPSPTIMISHGSAGVESHHLHISSIMHKWGYNVVIVDHYSAKGIASGYHNVGTVVTGATGPERALDAIVAARWINKQPWHSGKILLIGYSQGGATVNALASKNKMMRLYPDMINESDYSNFVGAAGIYPGCGYKIDATPEMISSPFPVQLHIARKDDLALPEWCETQAKNYQLIYYDDATHGFDFSAQNTRFTHRYNPVAKDLYLRRVRDFADQLLRVNSK